MPLTLRTTCSDKYTNPLYNAPISGMHGGKNIINSLWELSTSRQCIAMIFKQKPSSAKSLPGSTKWEKLASTESWRHGMDGWIAFSITAWLHIVPHHSSLTLHRCQWMQSDARCSSVQRARTINNAATSQTLDGNESERKKHYQKKLKICSFTKVYL